MNPELPPIVIDTREQRPYLFAGAASIRAGLPSGDYSIQGLESAVAIERKSLAYFVGSVTVGRDRFWRELARLQGYRVRAVVLEATMSQLERGVYRSRANPRAIVASVLAIGTDFGIPVVLAGTREAGEHATLWMLRRAWGHAGDFGLIEMLIGGEETC